MARSGSCPGCLNPWDQVDQSLTIPYAMVKGAMYCVALYCRECFLRLPMHEILDALHSQIEAWEAQEVPFNTLSGLTFETIHANAEASVRYLRGELDAPPFHGKWKWYSPAVVLVPQT